MPSFGTAGAIRAVPPNAGHLGQGIAYPLEYDAAGRLAMSFGATSVDDAVAAIVQTQPGERRMEPDFGMTALQFEPATLLDRARIELEETIADHEPRIASVEIVAVPGDFGDRPDVEIRYVVAGEANERTLTYPYHAPPATTSTGVG